jgi:3-methyl-2-oxobutanoate hydroxymethyltransferase
MPHMPPKVTAPALREMKARGEKICFITAYDAEMAAIADSAGVDAILVGDSVANTMLGRQNTISVTLEEMVHHTRAVAAAKPRALVVADLPFGTYEASGEQAFKSAVELMRAGAEAIKLEGCQMEAIQLLFEAGIPVVGHLGFTPQRIHQIGGFKMQGKGEQAQVLMNDAKRMDQYLCALVLELVPDDLAKSLTEKLTAPTIGIGAGPNCDGQVQVLNDVLGITETEFRHAKKYMDARQLFRAAIAQYAEEVHSDTFHLGSAKK